MRVQRTYFDIGIADRRPVHLRADGFGYVRHHHDGYQDCSPVRVQRAYFDIGIADRRTVHLRADGLNTFDLIMMDIRLVRLRACGCPRRRLCSALLAGQSILHADGWD